MYFLKVPRQRTAKTSPDRSKTAAIFAAAIFAAILSLAGRCSCVLQRDVQCVSRPIVPLHGTLEIKGHFILRMNCGRLKDVDLPANAPGEGGILMCRQGGPNIWLKKDIEFPECLPLHLPTAMALPVRLEYDLDSNGPSCTDADVAWANALGDNRSKMEKDLNVTMTDADSHCMVKPNSSDSIFQIEVELLRPPEPSHSDPQDYTVARNTYINYIKRTGVFTLPDLGQLMKSTFGLIQALCDPKLHAVGTIPVVHGIASCRGCPRSFVMDPGLKRCYPCPFGEMTLKAFSGLLSCTRCPDEGKWNSGRELFLKLCYARN